MTRNEFLKLCLGFGASVSSVSLLSSCTESNILKHPDSTNFSGKVVVIGAGAAGMMAAYNLKRLKIDFIVLEASSDIGGRVKKADDFADFPLDLGAEWIHTEPDILSYLINKKDIEKEIDIIDYNPKTISVWVDNELKNRDYFAKFYSEHKFKNSTWYDYFKNYILPDIRQHISFNEVVKEIDYSQEKIKIITSSKQTFTADKVIMAVPLSAYKMNWITFKPSLDRYKIDALNQVEMPEGIKMFFKFSQRFYPDIVLQKGLLKNLISYEEGEKVIYNAAFKKESNMNVLGLFSVGKPASVYTNLNDNQAAADFFLEELDLMFDGKASKYYQDHIIQNWSTEPYINGSYSHYKDYNAKSILAEPIKNSIYFAGEALSPDDSELATVHGAGKSGIAAVNQLLI